MLGQFDYEILEEISKGKELSQIGNIFNAFISELTDYLKLDPLYHDIIIKIIDNDDFKQGENVSILDFGVRKVVQNINLILEINKIHKKFLPFILFREACYSFIPKEASEIVKICVNQIVENNLNKLSTFIEWKKLIRDSLVDKDFIHSQFDKLKKFFKIEAREPFDNSIQFFFKEIRKNIVLSQNNNIDRFYDLIFEIYAYKTSRSLFNPEIIETLSIIIQIFNKTKLYLNLSEYQNLFREFKEKKLIESDLSLRRFTENIQWINRCTSIAPSYDIYYDAIDLHLTIGIIKFNPLLRKNEIKIVMKEWPFYHSPKFSENSFTTELFSFFIVPRIYLKDFLRYFSKLEEFGYVIEKKFYQVSNKKSIINLNYFTGKANVKKIIDPGSVKYKNKYEIETITNFPVSSRQSSLSIFNFTLLDRVRYFSVTGLTFDKRVETLNAIKEDIENELRKQKNISKQFKDSLNKIVNFKSQFLHFLEKNKKTGFLYLYSQLNYILDYLDIILNIFNDHPEISNIYQLQNFISKGAISQIIEEQVLFRNKNINKIIVRDYLPLYFQSISLFNKELEKYQTFHSVLDACYNLKIMDLNKIVKIVKEPNLAEEIYRIREKRYERVFKPINIYKITNEKIESTIEDFLILDPPVLNPWLINTILTSAFAKYYLELIIKNTPEAHKGLRELKKYFPRLFLYNITKFDNKRNFFNLSLYFLNIREKQLFLSVLYSTLKDSIISLKRYFWRGVTREHKQLAKDFYDFEKKQFFYLEDFFKQLMTYTQKIFGKKLEWNDSPVNNNLTGFLWSRKQNMDSLINTVNIRISRQDIDFNLKELRDLSEFRKNMKTILLNRNKFKTLKTQEFFKRYIKSIKFLPAFHKFGFAQYYLFFHPFSYKSPTFEIDLRLLFMNSFQKIKYPACIEHNIPILYKYSFPFKSPNKSYLNWLVKSKKAISEYFLFYLKKFYEIIQFNRNLTKEGWDYSSLRFKTYLQDVLFNPNYKPKVPGIREFDINELNDANIYGPSNPEFEALTQIYNIHSIDIKSYLGTRKYSIIENITNLLKKNLIFPYISLKNLDLQDKVSIFLPDIKLNSNEKIIKIFSFFNVCRIYEIEGEFYIYGFEDIKSFENGLFIDLWLPKCELDEFFEVFELIFEYFNIKYYLILTDLVDGRNLVKSIFGNLSFMDSYNPLKNLIWNDKDKIWINHKLFNEKFEPIYPDLLYGEKR